MANGYGFQFGGNRGKNLKGFGGYLSGRLGQAGRQRGLYDTSLEGYFADPTGGAEAFLPFFQRAAEGAAAPALRDFQSTVATRAANVASRFGGNPSTTELRTVTRAGDLFSRNLTEALARVGPAAIGASQARGSQLLGARQLYGGEEGDLQQMILASIMQQGKGSPWARIIGALLGGAGGFVLGGPPGAATGAQVGGQVGGYVGGG